jgi:hypothetical protein
MDTHKKKQSLQHVTQFALLSSDKKMHRKEMKRTQETHKQSNNININESIVCQMSNQGFCIAARAAAAVAPRPGGEPTAPGNITCTAQSEEMICLHSSCAA